MGVLRSSNFDDTLPSATAVYGSAVSDPYMCNADMVQGCQADDSGFIDNISSAAEPTKTVIGGTAKRCTYTASKSRPII
jgi:hypothetical protein